MKAACLKPIVLPSGYVVPCGKCEICRSDRRNEWSIRVQLQCKYEEHMPLMIGLDYAPEWLPVDGNNNPKLLREDVSSFIKAYKRKYHLTNDKFVYYGCGEYGGKRGRPHYHIIFFGDQELYQLYFADEHLAHERLKPFWKYGRVWIGLAEWSGMHYVTKYVLKDLDSNFNSSVPSFTISSKGLGMNYLKSSDADEVRKKLQYLQYNKEYIYSHCPVWDPGNKDSLVESIDYFRPFVPDFKVELDNGKFVLLPRVIKRKLLGSYEHFKDNPLWLPVLLSQMLDMYNYLDMYGDYDLDHDNSHAYDSSVEKINRIRQRLIKIQHDKLIKKL